MLMDDKNQRGGVWGSGPPYPNLPNMGQNMQPEPSMYGGGGSGAYGPSGGMYGGGGGGGSHYGNNSRQHYGGAQQSPYGGGGGMQVEMFMAAKQFMGRIIGQKGITINDLQRRSGCDIQINQDVMPGQDCEVSIRGTPQGIEMAKQMLREIIEAGPNHSFAGGNPHGGQGYHQQGMGQAQQYQAYGNQNNGGGYMQNQPQMYQQQQQQQQPPAQYAQAPAAYQQAPQAAYGYSQAPAVQAPAYAQPAASEWKSAASRDGQIYYYNERTGATQWDKPAGMP
eukprot:CAMPEP_0119573800 /NCGR_PEP_ID=MMETSP1352-20130426/45305_1 /TAXON_ID=265584 /ORGANISM="Stauroneis constricta, Strain CCMP1120" /LENGTH=279 /DNA_ID=CAMNT_0007623491 /DNA_START=11 /DNA_END=850 /DNA_ORIENTATION=+